jgi:thioredoxin-like negative regulator of GroEL
VADLCRKESVAVLTATHRPADALTMLDGVLGGGTDWMHGAIERVRLLWELGRASEADKLLAEAHKRWPEDAMGLKHMAEVASEMGRCAEARKDLKKLIDAGTIDAQGLNSYAWCALSAGPVTDDDVAQARRSVDETKRMNYAALNTLAMLQAERGQLDGAMDTLRESVPAGGTVRDADWLVMGRLAEAYGFREAAKKAYGRIEKPKHVMAGDSWSLAQARMAAMK